MPPHAAPRPKDRERSNNPRFPAFRPVRLLPVSTSSTEHSLGRHIQVVFWLPSYDRRWLRAVVAAAGLTLLAKGLSVRKRRDGSVQATGIARYGE